MIKATSHFLRPVVGLCCLLAMAAHSAETAESFEAAYAAAEAARQQAAEHNYEWRDTAKLLKQAKSAADKGDYDKAVMLANEAKFQGDMAVEQARLQAKIWRDAVPK